MDGTDNMDVSLNDTATDIGFMSWSSPTKSEKQPVDGIAYHHRLVIAFCFCIITVFGILGNTFVVIAVVVTKKLQTITNILVVNLAVADFLVCLILPFLVIGLLDGGDEYPLPEIICSLVTGVNYVSLSVSVYTLAAVAFVRWYVISKSIRGHRGLHTSRKIGIMVLVIWLMSIALVALPLSFDIGDIGYSRYYSICSVTDTNPRRFYFVVLQAGVILVALVITGFFYILIALHVTRHTRQLRKRFKDDSESKPNAFSRSKTNSISELLRTSFLKREIEITKNLFIVVIIFTICLLPSIVNFLIPGTSVLTLYGAMIMAANSSLNPIIYALKHPNFREAFKRVFTCSDDNNESPSTETRASSQTNL